MYFCRAFTSVTLAGFQNFDCNKSRSCTILLTQNTGVNTMSHFATIHGGSALPGQSGMTSIPEAPIFRDIVNLLWRDPILAATVSRRSRGWKRQIAQMLQLPTTMIESVLSPERYSHLLTVIHDNPAGEVPTVVASNISDTRSTHGSCLHGTGTCASCLHQTGTCGTCAACVSFDVDSLL
jgi:hypothetical protein